MNFSEFFKITYSDFKKNNPEIKSDSKFLEFLNKKYPGEKGSTEKKIFNRSFLDNLKNGRYTIEKINIIFQELTVGLDQEKFELFLKYKDLDFEKLKKIFEILATVAPENDEK